MEGDCWLWATADDGVDGIECALHQRTRLQRTVKIIAVRTVHSPRSPRLAQMGHGPVHQFTAHRTATDTKTSTTSRDCDQSRSKPRLLPIPWSLGVKYSVRLTKCTARDNGWGHYKDVSNHRGLELRAFRTDQATGRARTLTLISSATSVSRSASDLYLRKIKLRNALVMDVGFR